MKPKSAGACSLSHTRWRGMPLLSGHNREDSFIFYKELSCFQKLLMFVAICLISTKPCAAPLRYQKKAVVLGAFSFPRSWMFFL